MRKTQAKPSAHPSPTDTPPIDEHVDTTVSLAEVAKKPHGFMRAAYGSDCGVCGQGAAAAIHDWSLSEAPKPFDTMEWGDAKQAGPLKTAPMPYEGSTDEGRITAALLPYADLEDPSAMVRDLLTDLRHYAESNGVDFEHQANLSHSQFCEEDGETPALAALDQCIQSGIDGDA
jgi:hypothetical protein